MRYKTQRTIVLKKPLAKVAGNAFETVGKTAQATILPLSGALKQSLSGAVHEESRLMLAQADLPLNVGDGVCVEAKQADHPDFKAVRVSRYPRHIEAVLAYLPMAERGALDADPNEDHC